jgi:hypothetical protein
VDARVKPGHDEICHRALVRREDIRLLPFIDKGIDLGRDELLQAAADFLVVGGEEHESIYPRHSGMRHLAQARNP